VSWRALALWFLAMTAAETGCGCGSSPPPAPAAPPPSRPATATEIAPDPEPEEPAQPSRPRPPIDIKNDCGDVVGLFYGDPPKDGPTVRVAAGGTEKGPRNPDGSLVIWIVDEKGFGLANVHVTKRMKRVEIGRSCRTLYAH
jgi:hypothetical protein